MLKVLHLINYCGNGGSEKYILSLAEKLHGKQCTFYFAYSEEGPLLERIREAGIQAFNIPMVSPYDMKAAKKLAHICRENGIQLVHTHFLRENYIAIFSRFFGSKVRVINTSHLITDKSGFLKLSNRILTPFDEKIIAVCGMGKNQMTAEGINPGKIKVIYNGVDVKYWGEGCNSSIRRELGIHENDFVITSVGRFTAEKGHKFLIESIKHFLALDKNSSGKNVKFLLVGNGELLEDCKKQAEDLGCSGSIIFAGYRTDIKNILCGSDLYVSPSMSEALSISIIEALASGLPVAATNVGGTSEIIEGDDCGILARYEKVEEFAEAVSGLVNNKNLYERCSKNALKKVRAKFNLENMALETYNLYESAVFKGNLR